MDDRRFDQLAKDAASSRRGFRRGLAPAGCRCEGQVCREHANRCAGICGPKDFLGHRACAALHSCFAAGTRIAIADGTSWAIEQIEVGDFVLGAEGRVNRVIGVERPLLGSRLLYALNDSDFFVTAEHPFMTDRDWKAIDPAATALENSALPVGRLNVGDRLMVLTAASLPLAVPVGRHGAWSDELYEVEIETTRLVSLVGRPGHPRTPLYNLLLDGDHAFFANEMLMHNKG